MTRRLAGLLALFLCVGLLLVFVSDRIADRTKMAEQGRTVLLPLVEIGRWDLVHGDRIELIYAMPEIDAAVRAGAWPEQGAVAVTLDRSDVAHSPRRHDGGALAEREVVLTYSFATAGPGLWPSDRPRLSFGDSFFPVTKGQAADYLGARYAVLKVDVDGSSVVTGLADGQARPIDPER